MGGLSAGEAIDRSIEAVLRRDRLVALASIVVVATLAWLYLWLMAAAMDSASDAGAALSGGFDPIALTFTFLMWVVMMAAMMLPSASPSILLYGTLVRRHGARGSVLPGVWIFAAGYLLVWIAFSAAATLLQAGLEHMAMLTPQMTSASTMLSALALIAAGVYQLTPLKDACLGKCTNPLQFFLTRWRGGAGGAMRMGIAHGAYCVGCCWALMLLLFVAGVMNLLWVAAISVFGLAEKVRPSRWLSGVSAAGLIAAGVYSLTLN